MKTTNVSSKLTAFLLVIALVLSGIPFVALADSSNGESEGGTTNDATTCYYNYGEYGWRVSLFVAKDIGYDEATYKSLSLEQDYYCCGTTDITHFDVPKTVLWGQKNKIFYYKDPRVGLTENNGAYHYNPNCPKIPKVTQIADKVFYDDIEEVNAIFRQNTTILDILQMLASERGYEHGFDLVKDKTFTNHYEDAEGNRWFVTRTGEEWGEGRILPTDERQNLVPWVILYEPMALIHLPDGSPLAFLTATEFALTQGKQFNWEWAGSEKYSQVSEGDKVYKTGGLPGRSMQSLALKALPGSVTLEESWFGYPVSTVAAGGFWSVNEIKLFGGWGMGYLSPSRSIEIKYVDPQCSYQPGEDVVTSFIVTNRSGGDIVPADNLRMYLTARSDLGHNDAPYETVFTAVSEPVAVPAGETAYVWFRWTVPENVHGDIRLRLDYAQGGGVPAGDALPEGGSVMTPDTVLVHEVLHEEPLPDTSHTPEPVFEYRPAWFHMVDYSDRGGAARKGWHTWSYDEAEMTFTRHEWSATLDGTAVLTPDSDVKSSVYHPEMESWVMRSGYGIACDARAVVTVTVDDAAAGDGEAFAVTGAERGKFLFPEFLWSTEFDEYEPAEYLGKTVEDGTVERQFCLPENPDARNKRVHYTPIWFPDGFSNYRMLICWDACWTPGGTLRAETLSDGVSISGTFLDDWYTTH